MTGRELRDGLLIWAILAVLIVAAGLILHGPPEPAMAPEPATDIQGVIDQYRELGAQVDELRDRWQQLLLEAEERRAIIDAGIECGLSVRTAVAVWEAERHYDLPPGLLLAVIEHESGCDPGTVNHNHNGSTDGGLAQINSSTEAWLAQMIGRPEASRHDDVDAIEMAACYLRWLYEQTGDWTAVLTAYNRGLGGLQSYEAAHGTVVTPYSRAVMAAWNGGD